MACIDSSLEDLLTTGAALGSNQWPRGQRMSVLTASRGSLEVNPLWVNGDQVEALVVMEPEGASRTEQAT